MEHSRTRVGKQSSTEQMFIHAAPRDMDMPPALPCAMAPMPRPNPSALPNPGDCLPPSLNSA